MPDRWKYSVGPKGSRVTVEEREPGGPLYVRLWDPAKQGGEGGYIRRSLGHRNRTRARAYAAEQHAKLLKGEAEVLEGYVTLARLLALWKGNRLTRSKKRPGGKTKAEQKVNLRQLEMWIRFLGGDRRVDRIRLRDWEAFQDARLSGAIDARGKPVADGRRREVRARVVAKDLDFLRHALDWATRWQLPDGSFLLRVNPVRGFAIPREKNPRRPIATAGRYQELRSVTDRVMMEVSWHGKRRTVRSHLSEIFDLAVFTGRRLSAIRQLRYNDLRLEATTYGAIQWPGETDKQGRVRMAPLTPEARAALDRALEERPGIGAAPLFPGPQDPAEPVSRDLADKWLREAEQRADLEPQKGSLWHAWRRKWATERKHHPAHDVAAAGGWGSTEALEHCYQDADLETMEEVVLNQPRAGRGEQKGSGAS